MVKDLLIFFVALSPVLLGQQINHILVTGQSLARGAHGIPVLTTSDSYGNFTLSGRDELGDSFTGLIAANWGEPGEAYSFAGGAALSVLSGQTFTSVWTITGQDGAQYSQIQRTPASPGLPVTGTTPYSNSLIQIANAHAAAAALGRGYKVRAVMLTHGESDCCVNNQDPTYEARLVQLQQDYQFDAQRLVPQTDPVPMFLDQVGSVVANGNIAHGDVQGQWDAARDYPTKVFLTAPKYQLAYDTDNIHLSSVGYQVLGELHARALKKVLIDGGQWVPLAPRQITTPAATAIAIQFYVPSPPIVIDTSTLPAVASDSVNCSASSCYGFEVWCNSVTLRTSCLDAGGNPVRITDVAATASDTVTLTLSAAVASGTVEVRLGLYSQGGAPGTANAPHTNLRDSTPDIGLCSRGHLYNWAVFWQEPAGFTWNPYQRQRRRFWRRPGMGDMVAVK